LEIKVDDNLVLKQMSLEYLNELFKLVTSQEGKSLLYWCPDLKVTYQSKNTTEYHILDVTKKFEEDKTPDLLIFENGILAGLISLSPLYDGSKASEVGYWLGESFEGRGLITQSFPLLLEYASRTLNLEYIDLSTSVPNTKSQKIPKKFNFKEIKLIKDAETLSDGSVDHILWRLSLRS
jgi:ribosomal-protein-serine acetyltransferase